MPMRYLILTCVLVAFASVRTMAQTEDAVVEELTDLAGEDVALMGEDMTLFGSFCKKSEGRI